MKFLLDFFPILLFFIAFKTYGIFAATAVAIVASFIQVGWHWWRHRKFQTTHLVTFGIIVIFGGATLILQDRAFIMWKPTILNWLFAAAFVASHLFSGKTLVERMMGSSIRLPVPVWSRLNLSWIAFFVTMGFANLYVANQFFDAESAWRSAAGISAETPVESFDCVNETDRDIQQLCNRVESSEEYWVNFKLFGMMGLTLVFVLGQAAYLSRHLVEDEPADAQ